MTQIAAELWLGVYVQLMQQRARKAALRAMATVCAAIPKPDLRDPDLLGADIKKTAVCYETSYNIRLHCILEANAIVVEPVFCFWHLWRRACCH